jgi:amino acid adenylation domain-containing protein
LPRTAQISEITRPGEYGLTEGPRGLTELHISRRPPGVAPSLSAAQQQVWLHSQLAPNVPLYNEILILERTGALDRAALERSLGEISRRHEILRTTFPAVDGTVVPAVAEHRPIELPYTDLNALLDGRRTAEVLRIVTEEARQPFDLANGPLMRARLLCLSEENHVLVVTLHNLVADEWSLSVLSRELDALYQAYSAGEPSPLADLPLQYADYAHWQRNWFKGGVLEQHISYWRKRLAGIPAVLDLPTDRPRPPAQGFHGACESLVLSKSLSESLKELSESEGVTLSVTLLAAFQTLLSRYTGQSDVVVGAVVSGREGVGTENLIGPFAHTVVVRTDLENDPTFRELLLRLRDLARSDCEYQSMPFDRLVSELQPERDPSRNPLFQVLFSLTPSTSAAPLSWETANFEVDSGAAKVDLQLQLSDRPEGIVARFIYSTDLFNAATMVRMAEQFETLLAGLAAAPGRRIFDISPLAESERHKILVEFNATATDYRRDLCIHDFFEEQVERTPEATALICGHESLTYRELNTRANRLAHYLRKQGVGPEVLVGVCLERSIEMLVGILGILKAGGAYVPLDPAYPKERLAAILEDAKAPILLTQQRLAKILPGDVACIIRLDADWPHIAAEPATNPRRNVTSSNLDCVLFTSGSTGRPKGVALEHRSAAIFIQWAGEVFLPAEVAGTLFSTSICFDLSVFEIFVPLSRGGKVIIAQNALALPELPAAREVTLINTVPSAIAELVRMGGVPASVQVVNLAGEALPNSLAQQIYEKTGVSKVYNLYGPTEDTTYSTYTLVPRGGEVTIGRPLPNTQAYILDQSRQPLPIGVPGELYLAGDGLARGYFGREDLTKERFVPNPFAKESGARMYRTGDLARFRADGNIQYLGRIDNQVKLRGFRIELGEIEAVLRQHPGVNETVVVAREDVPGDKRLVAYFVAALEPAPTRVELRNFLKKRLPEYMLPSAFVTLKEMPLTPNGKVNRRALPAPEQPELAPGEKFVAPMDVVESQLVEIWETVLGVRPLGVRHNFFEVGGHSLVAVRLMHRIERAFGKNLPIATLLQAPTIEQLAAILRQKGGSPPWSCLVPIQTGGSKTPFFCVHGANGAVVRFRDLAQRLGSDQPFYGLQANGLDARNSCHTRAEDMASHYVKEIRSVQPQGPYFLGGYSFGGMVAFEMAQQLTAQGQERAVVVLFDTFCFPSQGTSVSPEVASTSSLWLNLLRTPASEWPAYIWRIATAPIRIIHRWLHVARLPRDVKKVRTACLQAEKDYMPRPYPGRVILFRSNHKPLRQVSDPCAGWSTYAARGLEIYEIEGNHENILLEPQVRCVAEQLKTCLDQTRCDAETFLASTSQLKGVAR